MKYIKRIDEAFIGPFVFNDKMSDEELKAMYDGALDGYANHSKGFQHAKSKYKEAYQAIEKILKKRGVKVDEGIVNENKFNIALNKMDEWLPEDPEAMERYYEIINQEGPKDMEKFFIEFGDEDRLQSYGLKSRDMKKLAKMAFESEEVNEAIDVNDPVLIAFRATRRDLPKLKLPKVKSRRLSFDKYMDLLDQQTDIDQEIKDMAEEMAQTLRDMEQEAEPEGGKIADKYGSIMMKQEKEYAKLKAKKAKIDARIEKHRMD